MSFNATDAFLSHKAYQLRKLSLFQTTHAGSGHPTSCLSAADIVAVLFFDEMVYDPQDPHNLNNDVFILSKGHAAPVLYAAWKEVGVLSEKDLETYRVFGSCLEGHPTMRFSRVQAATGSLGMGLSIGAGMALNARRDKKDYRTYVLMGDSEIAEGSVWEAVEIARYYKLSNLVAIVDVNRLGQSCQTMVGADITRYEAMFSSFGWHAITIDGHSIDDIKKSLRQARDVTDRPTAILAHTVKGYGVDLFADKEGYHGKALSKEKYQEALEQLKRNFPSAAESEGQQNAFHPRLPERYIPEVPNSQKITLAPCFFKGEKVATRKAYGIAVTALADSTDRVICLDAEVKNSTFSEIFEEKYPDRFVQCFIAEQNMVSMAVGFNLKGKLPFVSTFGAFFTRAHDQIRMAAVGNAALRLVGSHCGVSIGQDGASQMALEDIALMRALPQSIVLYPSDAVSAYRLVECAANYHDGISYVRTTREDTPFLYPNDETFVVGGCKVVRSCENARACVVAAGITVFEALKAAHTLAQEGVEIQVIDLYSIKPLDQETLIRVGLASNHTIVTVEDHYIQGGIGDAVVQAVKNCGIDVHCLAVTSLPRSGKPHELLAWAGIDATAISAMVKSLR